MCHIVSNEYTKQRAILKRQSLYTELCHICRNIKNNTDKYSDVGSGKYPRFQPTNNRMYDEDTVQQLIPILNDILGKYHTRMTELSATKMNYSRKLRLKFELYNDLIKEID